MIIHTNSTASGLNATDKTPMYEMPLTFVFGVWGLGFWGWGEHFLYWGFGCWRFDPRATAFHKTSNLRFCIAAVIDVLRKLCYGIGMTVTGCICTTNINIAQSDHRYSSVSLMHA